MCIYIAMEYSALCVRVQYIMNSNTHIFGYNCHVMHTAAYFIVHNSMHAQLLNINYNLIIIHPFFKINTIIMKKALKCKPSAQFD